MLLRLATATLLALVATTAAAQAPARLLVWINGDKGYNGLQRVGDGFTAASGVPVAVIVFSYSAVAERPESELQPLRHANERRAVRS